MRAYCDTSFFLRQLIPGPDRPNAIRISRELVEQTGFVPITRLLRFEIVQALRFEVWRNRSNRLQGLPAAQAEAALNLFLAEIGASFQIVQLDFSTVLTTAEQLTRSTPNSGWRTIDLLHVASAKVLSVEQFISLDEQQNKLARLEGFGTPLSKAV